MSVSESMVVNNNFSGGSETAAIRALLWGKLLLAAEKECKEFVVVFCTTWEVYRLFGVAATKEIRDNIVNS